MTGEPTRPFTLRHRQRLHGRAAFDAVFDARCRKHAGPLALQARPNELAYNRLGLVVPRRVGTAVRRQRIKRLVREAFRLDQHDVPAGYDMIVLVRPHEPAELTDYRRWLAQGFEAVQQEWQRRARRAERKGQSPP